MVYFVNHSRDNKWGDNRNLSCAIKTEWMVLSFSCALDLQIQAERLLLQSPSLESTLAEGPTDWKCSESLLFQRCTSGLEPSTREPIYHWIPAVWSGPRPQDDSERGKFFLNWHSATLFSSNDFTSIFFMQRARYLSCCRSSMGLFSPLRCSASHRACSRPRLFGVVMCSWIGAVPSQRFRLMFWALEGDICRQKVAVAVNLYMLTARIQSPVDITVNGWSLKKAVMSDWCQSNETNGIKLCLSDINPQSFLFTHWHLQFIKAPGLSTAPCRTIGFCFPFWKMSARLLVTRECSPFKREHLAQPPTAPSEETGD